MVPQKYNKKRIVLEAQNSTQNVQLPSLNVF